MKTKHWLVVGLLALIVGLMSGCSVTPKNQYLTKITVRPMPTTSQQPAYPAIQWVRLSDHSVVIRIDGYRDTLSDTLINRDTRMQRFTAKVDQVQYPTAAQNKRARDQRSYSSLETAGNQGMNEPLPLMEQVKNRQKPPYADSPKEMKAWRQWCNDKALTDEQYRIVVGTRLPKDAPFECDDFHRYVWRK